MTLNISRNTKNIYYKNEDTLVCIGLDMHELMTKNHIKRSQSTTFACSPPLYGATFSTPAFYALRLLLLRVSIACYAERCTSYSKSVRLSVTRWYSMPKRLELRSCGLHLDSPMTSFLTVNFSTKFQREHRERGRRM